MNYIPLIHEILKLCIIVVLVVFALYKWEDIKQIFSEKGGGMSSKRVIALMGMSTLCRLAAYTTHYDGDVDNNILIVLTVIVLTSAAIATFPQILDLFGKLKGFGKNIGNGDKNEPPKIE